MASDVRSRVRRPKWVAVVALVAVGAAVGVLVHLWLRPHPFQVIWQARTLGPIVCPPLVADQRVFVASSDGTVRCFDQRTGASLWMSTAPLLASRVTPVLHGGVLIVCSDANRVCGLNPDDGTLQWEFRDALGPIQSSPVVYQGVLFVAGDDGILRAVDTATGKQVHGRKLPGYVAAGLALSSGRVLVVPCGDGSILTFDMSAGPPPGNAEIPLRRYQTGAPVHSRPVAVGDSIYVGSDDGALCRIDATTARRVAHADDAIRSSLVTDEQRVYFGCNDGTLYAWSMAGETITMAVPTGGPVRGAPVVADNVVYFGSSDGVLRAADASQGCVVLASLDLGSPITGGLAMDGRRLYVGTEDGVLRCVASYVTTSELRKGGE